MKSNSIFILVAFLLVFLNSFGQQLQLINPNPGNTPGMQLKGQGTEFFCTPDAFYGQNPSSVSAYNSSTNYIYRCYDNFSGITDDITSIDWWGINNCSQNPMSFEISFYEDNAGSVGNQVANYTAVVTGDPTGYTSLSLPLNKYSLTLPSPVSNLSTGWVSVYANPPNNCNFYWSISYDGDNEVFITNSNTTSPDLAFCLYTTPTFVPISNWAITISAVFMLAFLAFRYRRRIVI